MGFLRRDFGVCMRRSIIIKLTNSSNSVDIGSYSLKFNNDWLDSKIFYWSLGCEKRFFFEEVNLNGHHIEWH